MIRFISRKIRYLYLRKENNKQGNNIEKKLNKIPKTISEVKSKLGKAFGDCFDFQTKEITIAGLPETKVVLAFVDSLIDTVTINSFILKNLMIEIKKTDCSKLKPIMLLKNRLISSYSVKEVTTFEEAVSAILSGNTIIFIENSLKALNIETKGYETRGVQKSETEVTVRGPRESFSECLKTNVSLLRRKIKNSDLKFELMTLGERTNTDVCICYIKDIAHSDIISTVKKRLSKIKTDAILESGYLEEFIEDAPFTIFPTVGNSEKPDVIAGKILEGRIAILCDGTPFVLTVPYLFIEAIQGAEDYYSKWIIASQLRIIRFIALLVTVALPAVYVALVKFHPDVIPFKLLLTIAASTEGIPFSPFIELLIMEITFEILREAGVRMPRPIGQAVSIVGALVLGEAAVKAGIISNPIVIIIAATAISSFVNPELEKIVSILRLIFLLAANLFGYFFILMTHAALNIHITSITSFGVPYLAPIAPLQGENIKDSFVRVPFWFIRKRPKAIIGENRASKLPRTKGITRKNNH